VWIILVFWIHFFSGSNVLYFGIYTPISSIMLGVCCYSNLCADLNLMSPSVWIEEWFLRPYGSNKLAKKAKKTQHSRTVLNATGQRHYNKKHRKREEEASDQQPPWATRGGCPLLLLDAQFFRGFSSPICFGRYLPQFCA